MIVSFAAFALARFSTVEEASGAAGVVTRLAFVSLLVFTINSICFAAWFFAGDRPLLSFLFRKQPHHLVAAVVDQVCGPAAGSLGRDHFTSLECT